MHIWDTRNSALVQSFPGHKDTITGRAIKGHMIVHSSQLKALLTEGSNDY